MWVCFLAFFDLRPSSLVNRPFSDDDVKDEMKKFIREKIGQST